MKLKDFFKKHRENIIYGLAVLGVLALVLILLEVFTGSKGESRWQSVVEDAYYGDAKMPAYEGSGGVVARSAAPMIAPEYAAVPASDMAVLDRKVIKNGHLSLLVETAESAVREISSIASRLGGFVENSSLYDSEIGYPIPLDSANKKTSKYGNIVIRVPSSGFETAMNSIRALGIKVERDSVNARDASAEYVDIEAQLKNLKAEEAQYLSIMQKAVKVEDILNVSSRLADVRGRIERMQAQFNHLNRQIEMSTISVDLRSEADIESVGATWRPISVAKQALQDMLESLTSYADSLIIFVINIPVLLLRLIAGILWLLAWVAGFYILWRILKYLKERFVD